MVHIGALVEGEYRFGCVVHPVMTTTLVVGGPA